MRRYRKHTSMGELISSACFFCVGLWWLLEAGDAYVAENYVRAGFLAICSLACLLATFRYPLNNLYVRIRQR